jgi:glycosyltransferase involved in cell wall biosynthesis
MRGFCRNRPGTRLATRVRVSSAAALRFQPDPSESLDAPSAHGRSQRRLRLMHVALSLEPGGTERLVIELAKNLLPTVDSAVCCLDRRGAWAAELEAIGVPVVSLGRRPGFRPGVGQQIAELVTAWRIDVLHCHHYTPFVYGQIASLLRRRVRVVYTEHGRLSDAAPSRKRRMVNSWLGHFPADIYAVSADLRRHMIAEGLPADRVRVLHNGVEPGPPPSPASRSMARRLLGLADDEIAIGTVARLDPVKDFTTLLDAMARVRQCRQGRSRLVIVGDGPERARLEARSAELGIEADVTFAGYRSDIRRILPAFDVFVNSSTHEGVSLTILEAMAAMIPVVATSVGGTPEVVVEGETGLLVPARDSGALAAAVGQLIRSRATRATMGEAGRLRVLRSFSMDRMTRGYWNAYQNVSEDS